LEIPRNATEGSDLVSLVGARAKATLRSRTNKETIVDLEADRLTGFVEFPRINYKYNGKKYRYVYGAGASESRRKESVLPETDRLIKYDLQKRQEVIWENNKIMASEPVFIPNPNSDTAAEDDGVLLSALLHRDDQKKVTLLVLDAKNMKELATVEFTTGGPVPGTFHGQWAQEGEAVHTY
jgi:carotenoid cleavage dioxygenase-like enzyme